MKKILALLLTLVMCLSLCGCGGGKEDSELVEGAEPVEVETSFEDIVEGEWKVSEGDFFGPDVTSLEIFKGGIARSNKLGNGNWYEFTWEIEDDVLKLHKEMWNFALTLEEGSSPLKLASTDGKYALTKVKDEDNVQSGISYPAESTTEEGATVPNNGEWDEILCSGDDYYLVKKEIDAYDGYKFMLGVVNGDGEWVQELTDTGKFVEEVRFRAEGSSETLRDSSCYAYLGEGTFLASPGVTVYTKDEESRIGPWENRVSYRPTGNANVSIWECLTWNVVDNIQKKFDASKISVFQDGYLLFCEEDEFGRGGTLNAMNLQGEITKLTCECASDFPVYSEGLFYARSGKNAYGFFDVEGNMVVKPERGGNFSGRGPFFENGRATITFENNAGSKFKGVIDKTGAFVGEPEKIQ